MAENSGAGHLPGGPATGAYISFALEKPPFTLSAPTYQKKHDGNRNGIISDVPPIKYTAVYQMLRKLN